MATAKKLPSGMWRCQASVDGERRSFTAYTKKEAEFLALEWQTRRKEKRNPDNLTIGEMIDKYIESRDGVLSPTTIIGYRAMRNNDFTDIETLKMHKVNEGIVQLWINDLSKRLSWKTVRNVYGLLKAATKLNYDIALPQRKKLEYRTPDVESCRKILNATKNTIIELPVILAMWCSLRMSEVRGVQWSKVSKDRMIIDTARIHMGGREIEKGTKTAGSERIIKIPPYIYEVIEKQPRASRFIVPYSANYINRVFHKILKENNIPDCRFHDLRHANASIMLMLGIPDKYAMERGGWSTDSVLKNVYQQTFQDESNIVSEKIDNFFMGLLLSHEDTHEEEASLLN